MSIASSRHARRRLAEPPAWFDVPVVWGRCASQPAPRRPSGDWTDDVRMNGQPVLEGEHVRLRPIRPLDRDRLRDLFTEPEVAHWWGTTGPEKAADETVEAADAVAFAIEVDGDFAGFIQYSEEEEPDYRHAAIDMAVSTRHQGRGLGKEALRTVARYLFEVRGHRRITIDPAASNARAIHVYESVGFRPVGLMRSYERGPDGTWHDGLLMDMLSGELR